MKFVIVWNSSLEVCSGFYESEAPDYGRFGGPMGSVTETTHLELPEGLDPQCLMAIRSDSGEVTLQTDPTKVQAHLDAQWTQVRSQQRQKLYESDWTCSVTDYEVPNKSEWVQYRAALREVTTQADPFNIVWPTAPGA